MLYTMSPVCLTSFTWPGLASSSAPSFWPRVRLQRRTQRRMVAEARMLSTPVAVMMTGSITSRVRGAAMLSGSSVTDWK